MNFIVISLVLWLAVFPLGYFASKCNSMLPLISVAIVWGTGLGFYLSGLLA